MTLESPYLRAWFDWNDDGVFDQDELAYAGAVQVGVNTISIEVPAGLGVPVNYRFRLYDGEPIGLLAQGEASFDDVDGGDIADGRSPNPTPTAVALIRLEAAPRGNATLVSWETAQELDHAGFDLYRSTSPFGPWTRLNAELVPPANPGSVWGAVYHWLDRDVHPGVTYHYLLEDVDIYGVRTRHGPVGASLQGVPECRIFLPLVVNER